MAALPSDVLHTPYPREPIPKEINDILGLADWLSPSHWLAAGMELVFGFNPAEETARLLAGDWQQVSIAAVALEQLAEYAEELGSLVFADSRTLLESWEGNAATSAGSYFEQLAIKADEMGGALRGIAGRYHGVAAGMMQMLVAVTSLLEQLSDALIAVSMKSRAAAALSRAFPPAAVVVSGWAAYDAWRAVTFWVKIAEAHGRGLQATQALTALIAGYLSTLRGMESVSIPDAYDHPGVER